MHEVFPPKGFMRHPRAPVHEQALRLGKLDLQHSQEEVELGERRIGLKQVCRVCRRPDGPSCRQSSM